MAYENMDWEEEIIRIICAFDAPKSCYFEEFERCHSAYMYVGFQINVDVEEQEIACTVLIEYSWNRRSFEVYSGKSDNRHSCEIRITWEEKLDYWRIGDMSNRIVLLRGLFKLGLFTPEVAGLVEVAFPATERLAMKRDFELKMNSWPRPIVGEHFARHNQRFKTLHKR